MPFAAYGVPHWKRHGLATLLRAGKGGGLVVRDAEPRRGIDARKSEEKSAMLELDDRVCPARSANSNLFSIRAQYIASDGETRNAACQPEISLVLPA